MSGKIILHLQSRSKKLPSNFSTIYFQQDSKEAASNFLMEIPKFDSSNIEDEEKKPFNEQLEVILTFRESSNF